MLMLLFHIGDERYALESRRVVEVVPRVALKKLHQAPEYIAGVFNYRSRIVPVIDLCHLIRGTPSSPHLSSRIILVNYQLRDRQASVKENSTSPLLGLMAERVTETLDQPETEFVQQGIKVNAAPYLGEMIMHEKGMIQCVRVDYLLPESQRLYLLPETES